MTKYELKSVVLQRRNKDFIRYKRRISGDQIQMSTCKIAPRVYKNTAVDDCSRYRILDVFKLSIVANTFTFIDKIIEEMPFSIQGVQTDRTWH